MVKFRMSGVDEFSDRPTLEKYLADQLASSRLALVLGAGISKAFGLPAWEELLDRMFSLHSEPLPVRDAKRQAEFLRNKFYKDDQGRFLNDVHSALYRDVDTSYEVMRRCDTLAAIASLVMTSRRGSAAQIITFNWDDLLETYLEYHGFLTASVDSDRHWATSADVTIFHPHGFLPLDAVRHQTPSIIFDQWSYTSIMGEDGKLWRETLLSIMRARTSLLIGLSGNDDNLDSLLKECKGAHASGSEHTAFWGITYVTKQEEADLLFWQQRGIFPVIVADYERDLPQRLFEIAQLAAQSMRQD
jgi:hypothetical protein